VTRLSRRVRERSTPRPPHTSLSLCPVANCSSREGWCRRQRTANQSLTINSSGPLRIIPNDDGTTTFIGHGPILWTFFRQDVGGPGLFLLRGSQVITANAAGFATSASLNGNKTDICAVLA
jgi:hypothetical protein